MKFRVQFKTPDAFDVAMRNVRNEREHEECLDLFEKFSRFGEMVTIEFDTETQTAVVVPVKP